MGFSVPPFDQGSHSLESSLNSRGSPWKVLKFLCKSLKSPWFSSTLNVVAWKVSFDAFWLSKTKCSKFVRTWWSWYLISFYTTGDRFYAFLHHFSLYVLTKVMHRDHGRCEHNKVLFFFLPFCTAIYCFRIT